MPPSMWSKDRFSMMSTMTCLMGSLGIRFLLLGRFIGSHSLDQFHHKRSEAKTKPAKTSVSRCEQRAIRHMLGSFGDFFRHHSQSPATPRKCAGKRTFPVAIYWDLRLL